MRVLPVAPPALPRRLVSCHSAMMVKDLSDSLLKLTTWEYRTVFFHTAGIFTDGNVEPEAIQAKLHELGQQGWELVSSTPINGNYGTTSLVLIFKRPWRPAEDKPMKVRKSAG